VRVLATGSDVSGRRLKQFLEGWSHACVRRKALAPWDHRSGTPPALGEPGPVPGRGSP
jgi:hypothetical protein